MKKLVWLLAFTNLGLLTYFNLDHILPSTQKAIRAEIHPEKINVLTQQQIEALPKKVIKLPAPAATPATPATPAISADTPIVEKSALALPKPVANTCYEWGVFSIAKISSAQIAASNLSLKAKVKEQSLSEAKRYWVYKPPFKSAEVAQAKALELNALGIDELFVVQDSKWKNAISFGVFEDEKLATNLLKELKAKGVKDIVKAVRNQGKGHASLLFSGLTDEKVAELKKLKPEFPEADLKEVSCN